MIWRFVPETIWKNSLSVRSSVCGFVLSSFGCSSTPFHFLFLSVARDIEQVGTGHPHTHWCWSFFFVFVPPRLAYRPFWPCVLFLGVFFGVPFWAPRVFGILLELMGLELARPFRGPFLGCEAARVFPCLLCLVFVSPLLFCFAASHVLLEGPPMARPTAGPGRSTSRPSPERGPGGAPRGRRVGPLLVLFLSSVLCLVLGYRDPHALRQEPFVWRECPFRVASWALTRTFCPLPQVFFLFL